MGVFDFFRRRRQQMELMRAMALGDFATVTRLVEGGLDVNFQRYSSSPLASAVRHGNRDIVNLLFSHGADLAHPANQTVLVAAAWAGDHDMIDRALAAGQDIHFEPPYSPTPLKQAAFRNLPETMRFLVSRGATKEDFAGGASWHGLHRPTIEVLLEIQVDVPKEIAEAVKAGNW